MTKKTIVLCALALPCLLASDAHAGPAARTGDMHVCPGMTVLVPHVGGPVTKGSPNVRIGGLPAAREGDLAVCVGPLDTITRGSKTVLINGKGAASIGSGTAHGGSITIGFPTVIIGG